MGKYENLNILEILYEVVKEFMFAVKINSSSAIVV